MRKYLIIALLSIMASIYFSDYLYKNSSKEQIVIVLSGLIASTSYLALNEICDKIDQCRKK